jgi:hypothetical protein
MTGLLRPLCSGFNLCITASINLSHTRASTAWSRLTTASHSLCVPAVMRRHPVHPTSLPRYRTTTPSCSASIVYALCARLLSAFSPALSRISASRKLASLPPRMRPTPGTSLRRAASQSRFVLSSSTLRRIISTDSRDSARNASVAVGVEMLYGALVADSTCASEGCEIDKPSLNHRLSADK